ncbi:myosin-I heavy chain-like [Cylas formicarius]|uniref:myosin-I heavy chain-like n=1 Tax=Cylas formicarius TaxID=197179 RepID=UPI002958D8B6|nr:myosin-I heavy chain-like [Cylas formicarius]XP_060529399.1 myosin-I heavy chain-like [Cylas formicarius]
MENAMVELDFSSVGTMPKEGVPDMTHLTVLDEAVINKNLKVRYERDKIYTYTGSILVAVNPYKDIDIYSQEYVTKYHRRKMSELEPHVFALAEAAYNSLQMGSPTPGRQHKNQSLVISGESGAGKTESTRFILQYLCSVTSGVSAWVEQQILEANTILEAFGNAKTVRNDNSSRFGKFMQVCFDSRWMIAGCIVQDYLLEQSRLTFQGPGERNYHVFYQLVEEAKHNNELATNLHLREANFYIYLNQSDCIKLEGDARRLDSLRLAFQVLQVPVNMCNGIFQTLSAILWLGNLKFEDVDGEKCQLTKEDESIVDILSKLLGLENDSLKQVVLLRQINVRGNITEIPLTVQQARENRHAMAKALYSRSFAWLINHINNCINPGQDSSRFLGVLDIFGFENFAVNSFEQLCINYTNEKLHKFFNHYVFALEQEIYQQEEINFNHISFTDNTLCLELLEKPPRCILRLLSEQCHLPRGCDASYITNLHGEFENHERYVKGDDKRRWETEFGVKHYAGCVTYNVKGFVDKNRDVQQDVFFDIISRSTNEFVQDLATFQDLSQKVQVTNGVNTVSRGTSKGKPTVSDTFRYQLQALVDVLQSTTPWYVRCIKPNKDKLPNDYDDALVLDQLKYLGMLDIIRIRKEGFPIHMAYEDFVIRYHCLSKNRLPPDVKTASLHLIESYKLPKTEWQLGKTKVFLRSHVHEPLEDTRNKMLKSKAILIQKTYRKYKARREFLKIRNAVLRIQHAYKGWKLRIEFLRKRRAAIVIQSHLRGVFAREVAAALREMRRVEEEMRKREKLEEERKQREMERKEKQAREADISRREHQKDQETNMPHLQNGELEESERAAEQEIAALSHMAEQLKPRLTEPVTESVDLDNLFAFLSDVQPQNRNNIIDEIGEKMNELVEDLDVELETVIQQELEGLAKEQQLPTPPKMGHPTLPEPTGPPPPPPPAFQSSPETEAAPPDKKEECQNRTEPIYESVLPREEPSALPVCVSPPPLPAPPRLPSESPKVTPQVSRSSSTLSQNWKNQKESHELLHENINNVEREQRRKVRIEKKLQELNETNEKENNIDDLHYDMVEFANIHFNAHERSPEGTIIATLTRKRQSSEMIPKYEMVTYYKGTTIPNSHIHMYDPDNVNVACIIFRDLSKYIRGELNAERELQVIQSIIGYALEREELRDEVFVQCIRQATNNPSPEATEKVWLLLCLCVVAFQPSKLLYRYFLSFLKKNLSQGGRITQYVQWCLDNCNNNKITVREHPPSSVEVAAMKRLGTIVCRFFFLDGRTKAIDVHPTDTAGNAAKKLAERLGLKNLDGWAIYQSRQDGEEHVRAHHYLYDIIAQWEMNQNKLAPTGGLATLGRRSGQGLTGGENRFIFKRRLFKSSRELSQDPVEVNLLYAQAVHSIVKCDDFPVTEKVALQLAGLQAQVALGNPKDNNKLEYYTDIDTYLPYRISKTRGDDVWVPIIAQAHRQYGANRTELTAKALYLSCVMQYPLYGTTMFPVTYRGYWSYGNALILGVNCEGIMLIKSDDKFVLNEFRYQDVESILLDPSDSFITLTLQRHIGENNHKCYVFETKQKNEIGSLIASYCPSLAGWLTESETPQKRIKSITNEDRVRLYHNLVNCRRALVDHEILRKPMDSSGSFLRNTLRRLSKHKLDKLRQEHGGDTGETYKGFHYAFWAFSRQPLSQSISRMPEAEEQIMLQVFQIILTYAGLGQNGEVIRRVEDEHVSLLQTILERCMRKDSLLCELYLQLVKQTTDHPDPNSRVNLRHWALLSLSCSVVLPPNKVIRRYLIAHLKRCGSDYVTEEGKYARFAEKCLLKTQGTRRRQWPPSREEILCTINRRPVYARFHFMDGQYHSVEFHPSATARDVLETVRDKIGLTPDARGYAIYEVLGNSERSLAAEEKVADVMAKWERYRTASAAANATNNTGTAKRTRPQHHFFLFKKHLFMDNYINLNDPVEKELLYHQVLHDLRTDRFPITDKEAMMLTALQAQLELGDFDDTIHDYRPIACHCLPARMVPTVPQDGVQMHHQSLRGMTPSEAKQAFLNLIQSWPLHKATIFDVMQSFTSNWPRVLWLAVDQKGLHLLEHRSRNTLCTYDYSGILSYSPALNCLMIITGSNHKQSKVILTTAQAFQIATLIREYMEVLHENMVEMRKVEQTRSRPVSALHPHAPLVPPQPS